MSKRRKKKRRKKKDRKPSKPSKFAFRTILEYRRWLTRNDPMPVLIHQEPDGVGGFFNFFEEAIPELKKNLRALEEQGDMIGRTLQIFKDKVLPKLA